MRKLNYKYIDLPKVSDENVEEYIEQCRRMLPKNTTKPVRVNLNRVFDTDVDQMFWEQEQIEKCIHGGGPMCGKEYFYFQFGQIQNISGGNIRPQFRVVDNEWFKMIESCRINYKNVGKGLVCVKRRRCGASWREAADALHDSLFTKGATVGMDSKTERDSQELFKKVKFMYDNLPTFLKLPTDGGRTKDVLRFARRYKDEKGNVSYKGNMSEIYCVAPTDSAHEGRLLTKWICDEIGKRKNLLSMYALTMPCLEQEGVRLGIPIFFGTAGDVDAGSLGLEELWMKNEAYDLMRFFFTGWMGIKVDDYGNDDIDYVVRNILKIRKKKFEAGAKDYYDYVQQYPLTVPEALMRKDNTGIGNMRNIDTQIDNIIDNPVVKTIGCFEYREDVEGNRTSVFVPNGEKKKGYWEIFEHPNKHLKNGYVSGADPADHDFVTNGSELSIYILARQYGSLAPRIVATMTYRPENNVDDFYEQSFMGLIYYNSTTVLIENNRYGMIKYAQWNGYTYLLRREPKAKHRIQSKGYQNNLGIRKGTASTQEMERCINEFTTDYCDMIPDLELLKEFRKYGFVNTDRVVAFGWACVALQDLMKEVKHIDETKILKPTFGYKIVGNKVVRYRKNKSNEKSKRRI